MKHSYARNVIKHVFDLLKGQWAILRRKSYYPLQVQCRTILACYLMHNLINREMTNCEDIDNVEGEDSAYVTTTARDDIQYIETTNEWSQWWDKLAKYGNIVPYPQTCIDEEGGGHYCQVFSGVGTHWGMKSNNDHRRNVEASVQWVRLDDDAKYIIVKNKVFENWVRSHPVVKGLLNKPFLYYDKLAYVFRRDRATGHFAKTFANIESNEPVRYEGFDMLNGNEEFPSIYSHEIDIF
ncbi:retrotransposon protein [Cucumis melo var. makuwa]|uniref:Retrotransposon protein n=1 Tax=Cucumis melo var. makuwa TaxID=1194695 RepID=A0A5D3E583_CUCMM|nr:retrotransposon protein [Cucumis melo var. makuwa]TYK30751.1 retrotransposon protein [Cucumis melo var. makuwa]